MHKHRAIANACSMYACARHQEEKRTYADRSASIWEADGALSEMLQFYLSINVPGCMAAKLKSSTVEADLIIIV